MKKSKSSMLRVALCLILTLALFPAGALAEEPGDGGQSDDDYTITLLVGADGSVASVTRKVAEEDVSVEPDEEDGNTYTVPAGSDVTFTFEPADHYIIDELRVDDKPERTDQDNKFKLSNVRSNQTLEITFIKVEEYTFTVPQVEHVTIEVYNNGDLVDLVDNQFTSFTREMVRYYFTLDPGYKLKEFSIQQKNGPIEGVFTFYDPDKGMFYADVETNFHYTVKVEVEELKSLPTPYYAILDSEAEGEGSSMKAAIRRELGLQGIIVTDGAITIDDLATPPAIVGSVGYKKVTVGELGVAHFYTVEKAKTLLIMTEPTGKDKELTVYDRSKYNDSEPINITIPTITSGKIYAFGPYGAFAMDMSRALGLDLPIRAGDDGAYNVTGPFYNMQWHVINQGTLPETTINWYPTNIVTADAMYIEANATKNGITQEAGAWAIDTSPRINSVDDDGTVNYRLEIFFGNDTVTISPPTEGNVTGVVVRTESDSPGYTFEDVPEDESGLADAVKVTFHSDYYDNITVPLTLTVGTDELTNVKNVKANVTIHRVGVEIQEHSIEHTDGSISQIWHGTQNGSQVDLSEYGFRLTATYYIPDGEEAPYGLFVTRIYSGGRVETETIPDSMKGVYVHGEAASAVDYIVYSGANAASAPVSVSVLVLKNEPDENTFGGVDFGSGIGVTRTK